MSGLGRKAWHVSLAAHLLGIPGLGGILSELYKSNQLLIMWCLGLSFSALDL